MYTGTEIRRTTFYHLGSINGVCHYDEVDLPRTYGGISSAPATEETTPFCKMEGSHQLWRSFIFTIFG